MVLKFEKVFVLEFRKKKTDINFFLCIVFPIDYVLVLLPPILLLTGLGLFWAGESIVLVLLLLPPSSMVHPFPCRAAVVG